jgi:two-component system sensor histidine kinase DegS
MTPSRPGTHINPHIWIIGALFAVCCILHYPGLLPLAAEKSLSARLGFERHALERILFLGPVTYTAFLFGLRPGAACLLLAGLVMLPRALLLSPAPTDALAETGLTVGLGAFIIGWLETRRREISRREQDILKLESVKRELEAYVSAARENERRIRSLHSISRIINHSFALKEVAAAAAGPVRKLLHADAVLIYLSGSGGALKLAAQNGLPAELARKSAVRTLKQIKEDDLPHEGSLLLSSGVHRSQPLVGLTRQLPNSPLAAVPFRARGKLAGLLCVFLPYPEETPRARSEQERLMSLLGSELEVAAERSFYFRELERVSMHFREVFEKAHDAIWLQNRNGDIVSANQAAARLSGYDPPELVNLNAARLFGSGKENRAREVEVKLLAGEPVRQPFEQKIVRKDGSPAFLMQTTSLLGDTQTPVFLHLARDISDERRLRESLRLYAGQIGRAHEDERLRVARELHDDTVQTLVSICGRLDHVLASSPRGAEDSHPQLEEIRTAISDCMVRIRRFIQDLRPPTLDVLGLFPTLRELAGQTSEQSGIDVVLRGEPPRSPLTAEEELLVYRIVQEAVRNSVKHAGGNRTEIRVEETEGKLAVLVADDGRGFTVDPEAELVEKGKLGLMGMKERAYLLGGDLEILSAPGKGTKIRLAVPRRPA